MLSLKEKHSIPVGKVMKFISHFPCTTEAILKIPRGRHIRVLSDSQDGASAHANPKASICSTHAARGVAIPLRALSTKNFTSRLKSEST